MMTSLKMAMRSIGSSKMRSLLTMGVSSSALWHWWYW